MNALLMIVLLGVVSDVDGIEADAQRHTMLYLQGHGIESANDAERGCSTRACAIEGTRENNARYGLIVSVFADSNGAPGEVAAYVVDPEGHEFPGRADVVDGDLVTSIDLALAQAMGRVRLGPGPWLRISGGTEGASVSIDGHDAGLLPYVARIESGQHEITIVDPDGTEEQYFVEVPLDQGREEVLVLPAPAPRIAPTSRRRTRRIIGTAALGAVSLAAGGTVLGALARRGCAVRSSGGRCTQDRQIARGPAIGFGVVAVAAAVGAVMLGLRVNEQSSVEVGAGTVAYRRTF